MKKILLLIDDLSQGGAERQMIYLVKVLSIDNQVRLVKFYEGKCAYSDMLNGTGINIETYTSGKNRWRRIWAIRNIVKTWNPDLTIVYKDGTCIAACLAKLFIKYKLTVSERNSTQKLNWYERIKFFTFRLADYIVPNSKTQTDFIIKNYPNLRKKIHTITNVIDLKKFSPSQHQHLKKRVIITARLSSQKNVLRFLEALKIADFNPNKVHFDWFGKIHSIKYFEEIITKIKALGLSEIISFHTEGSDKIQEEYKNSTHFCLPSLYEGFPNVLCEAMASGLVCCASNVSDNPYILTNPKYLFNPYSPDDIADKLKVILSLDKTDQIKESRENRIQINKLCSLNSFAAKYKALLS